MIDEERPERAAASRLRAHQLLERTAYVAEIGEAGKVEEEVWREGEGPQPETAPEAPRSHKPDAVWMMEMRQWVEERLEARLSEAMAETIWELGDVLKRARRANRQRLRSTDPRASRPSRRDRRPKGARSRRFACLIHA